MSVFPIFAFCLDAIGIALAILDFTGASRRIEERLATYRDWEKAQAERSKAHRSELLSGAWPKWLKHTMISLFLAGPPIVLLTLYLYWNQTHLSRWTEDWPSWAFGLLVAALPGIYLIYILLITLFTMSLSVWWSSTLHRIFWALSRPPAGIMGTVGLTLTLASNLRVGW
ncbi:MAG: hypothetical protein AAF950_08200 [Pseudomonadota bacterium]